MDPSREAVMESVKERVNMLRQQKETVVKASRAYQDEVKKAYPGVPLHQVGTMIENDANEVAYNRKYRDYLLKETKEAATRTLNIEKRIEELRKNNASLDLETKQTRRKAGEDQISIKEFLDTAARNPSLNQALSDHYLRPVSKSSTDQPDTAEQITSKMTKLRADMDEYEQKIFEAVLNQAHKAMNANWDAFKRDTIQPLLDLVAQHERTIDELIYKLLEQEDKIVNLSDRVGDLTLRNSKLEQEKSDSAKIIASLTKDLEAARAQT